MLLSCFIFEFLQHFIDNRFLAEIFFRGCEIVAGLIESAFLFVLSESLNHLGEVGLDGFLFHRVRNLTDWFFVWF